MIRLILLATLVVLTAGAQNDSLLQSGLRSIAEGRPQQAVDDLLAAGADTGSARARSALGQAYAALNEVVLAKRLLAEAAALDTQDTAYRFHYARFLHQNLFLAEAAHEYRRVLEQDPSVAPAWFSASQVIKLLGEPDSSVRSMLSQAVRLNPRDYLAHYHLGSMLLDDSSSSPNGVEHLRTSLGLNPSFLPSIERLASHFFRRKEDLEAAAYYRRAIDLRPSNAELHFYLGEVYRRQRQFDPALASLHEAVRLDTTKATYVGQLGYAYFQRKDYDSSAVAYRRAIALEPDNPQFHLNLALAYERMDSVDLAGRAYRAAASAHQPDAIADIYLQLGHVYFRAHRYTEAQVAYRRSLDIDPEQPQAQFYLALAFDQADKTADAVRWYRSYFKFIEADTSQRQRQELVRSRLRALETTPRRK